MRSGLSFNQDASDPLNDENRALWVEADAGAYAAAQPLKYDVGSHWQYASGSSIIVSRIIKQTIGDQKEYFAFPREELFNRIGMRNAVIEPDASGTFVEILSGRTDQVRKRGVPGRDCHRYLLCDGRKSRSYARLAVLRRHANRSLSVRWQFPLL